MQEILDIAAWAEETKLWASKQAGDAARKLYKRVVGKSPNQWVGKYSKGHFNHNWRLGVEAQVGEIEGTTWPVEKQNEIDAFITPEYFLLHPKVTMTNSTEYVSNIEYTGWKRKDGSPGHPAYAPVATAISQSME